MNSYELKAFNSHEIVQTAQLDYSEQFPEHFQNKTDGNNRIYEQQPICRIALKALKIRLFPRLLEDSSDEWHSRGQRFDPAYLHQEETVTERWLFFLLVTIIWAIMS